MTADTHTTYQSYLIRCWVSTHPAPGNGAHERFVVERITGDPQRWGFDTLEDLVAFLRVVLREGDLEPPTDTPARDPCG